MLGKPPANHLKWTEVEHHGLRFAVLSYRAATEEPAAVREEAGQDLAGTQSVDPLERGDSVEVRKSRPGSD